MPPLPLPQSPAESLVELFFRNPVIAPLAAKVDFDESAERDIGTMNEWAAACTVQRAEGFQLTSEDGRDWSVMTTEPLEAGTPVLSVPNVVILTASKSKYELEQLGDVQVGADLLGRLGAGDQIPQFYLFLKILAEYEKGDQSPWYPWLNSLPRLYFNAASMTNFCFECLPPLVFALARTERIRFDNFYNALQKVDVISERTKSDQELAQWAFNIVCTRSWGTDPKIVPMADMFNHGTETEIVISYDEEDNFIAYVAKDVEAGSPLRMSYGDPTNPSYLFSRYGFLDETSPASFCKIMLNPTPQLVDMGYDHSRMLFYKDTGDISTEVWDVMLYQNLASNRDVQQAFYEAHMQDDAETKGAIHQQYFLETATSLQSHVNSFLTQLDELSEKSYGQDPSEHPRLPLILRHNEFVKTTFLAVKDRLDDMVAQAYA
mmetsp:Transcript_34159/g.50193  ORF Transcript_34159/g.50193 Transcript_34159/m.50193 type:complete len:433 (-) Transcript_34159:80-1378(-)